MSEAKKRKSHTPEFVHPVTAGQWKKEIQEQAKTLFEGKRGPKPIAAYREPEMLYSEIGKLKMELDWLKKSQGSACPDAAYQDRQRGCGARGPAMRLGRGIPSHDLCTATAWNG